MSCCDKKDSASCCDSSAASCCDSSAASCCDKSAGGCPCGSDCKCGQGSKCSCKSSASSACPCGTGCNCGQGSKCSCKSAASDACPCGTGCGCGQGSKCSCKSSASSACPCGAGCNCGQGSKCSCKSSASSACPCGAGCNCGQDSKCSCKSACPCGTGCKCGQGAFCSCKSVASGCKIGVKAPAWTKTCLMPDGSFKELKFPEDFKGKYTVVFFYPLDFTFVCPTEICSFSDRFDEFAAINCQVVGVSVDSEFTHLAWCQQPRNKGGLGALKFPLVADVTKSLSAAYDALLPGEGFTCRALYIINEEGVVRHITMNDPPVGRDITEVLRVVQGYQFVDQHGEVCPANWKPGQATMKADPKGSQEYFAKHA